MRRAARHSPLDARRRSRGHSPLQRRGLVLRQGPAPPSRRRCPHRPCPLQLGRNFHRAVDPALRIREGGPHWRTFAHRRCDRLPRGRQRKLRVKVSGRPEAASRVASRQVLRAERRRVCRRSSHLGCANAASRRGRPLDAWPTRMRTRPFKSRRHLVPPRIHSSRLLGGTRRFVPYRQDRRLRRDVPRRRENWRNNHRCAAILAAAARLHGEARPDC